MATAAGLSEAFTSGATSPRSDCLKQFQKNIRTKIIKYHIGCISKSLEEPLKTTNPDRTPDPRNQTLRGSESRPGVTASGSALGGSDVQPH